MGAHPPIEFKSQWFNIKLNIEEIWPEVWGVPINFDVPKLDIKVNIGISISVRILFFTKTLEFTLCLR